MNQTKETGKVYTRRIVKNLDRADAQSLTVAIPAFNEERYIEITVNSVLQAAKSVPSLHIEVLIVDDGSTDQTANIVQGLCRRYEAVRMIQNPKNLGLGTSMRRAIASAQGEKFLTIPGDNDISVSLLEQIFKNAYAAEVVMCYFQNDEVRGRPRFLLSTLFRLIYTTSFDIYAQYLNGPAVYPVGNLRELHLHSTRFSIPSEINVKLLRQGLTYVEIPSNRQGAPEHGTSVNLRNLMETFQVFLLVLLDVYVRDAPKYAFRPIRVPYDFKLSSVTPDETVISNNN
jgi:glycosyltransferase involved in cell wall biosynthesis